MAFELSGYEKEGFGGWGRPAPRSLSSTLWCYN